jgi:hypothetical protein
MGMGLLRRKGEVLRHFRPGHESIVRFLSALIRFHLSLVDKSKKRRYIPHPISFPLNTNQMILLAVLVALVAAGVRGCPFYQVLDTPAGDPTTNYTLLSAAMTAAMAGPATAVPIVVCDGARVRAGEVLPVITSGITIMGESGGEGTLIAALTIDNMGTGAVFTVSAPNGESVVVQSLAIVAGKQTLFSVTDSATLTLRDFKCELTSTCVLVNTATTTGAVPPGLDADTAVFIGSIIAILHQKGNVACRHCSFEDTFEGAIVTRLSVYDPYVFITLYDVHFVNTLYPLAYQSGAGAPLSPPEISPEYVDRVLFFNTQTYSVAATTVELFGTTGCPACESCDCPPCYNKYVNISLVVLLALAIAICVVTCAFRANTSNAAPSAAALAQAQRTKW